MTDLRTRLDDATRDHRLLEHPFYKAWAGGTLTPEDLSFYSTQYWRQVEAFPGYLENLAGRLGNGDGRAAVNANLSDEIDDDHPGLWVRFAEAFGVGRSDLESSKAEPETIACVDTFDDGTSSKSPAFALGMLYAYESQTPEVAATKVRGLRDHYGIDGDALEYFELHGALDVTHSDDLVGALESTARSEADVADAEAGARAGAAAVYGLLDGVARVRGIGDC